MTVAPNRRPRVLVVGSGFGGLFTTQALKKADADVTVIAKTSHHLFQPLLYQVATGILSPGEVAPSTREVLAHQDNAEVFVGDVQEVDLERKLVHTNTLGLQRTHQYDHLVMAAGSNQSWFGNDQFAVFAPGMKSIDDALELRSRIFGAFELAEIAAAEGRSKEEIGRLMTFVVIGAGPTGVEMAGQLAELAKRTLRKDFRHIDPQSARIILLDAAPTLLGTFHESLQRSAIESMAELGIEVRLNAMVVDVDGEGIEIKDPDGNRERIDSFAKVWAAGVAASPLGKKLADQVGIEVDKQGRVPVEPDLTLPGHPEVYVIGDMAAVDGVPGVAPAAMQEGRYTAAAIMRALKGEPASGPFEYKDKGNMATISRFEAIAEIGSLRLRGTLAWASWLVVHLFYIIGFKHQVTTLLRWGVSFLGKGRSERTVTQQQMLARLALKEAGTDVQRWIAAGPKTLPGDEIDTEQSTPKQDDPSAGER